MTVANWALLTYYARVLLCVAVRVSFCDRLRGGADGC